MNIRKELSTSHSVKRFGEIAKYIGNDPQRFAMLMDIFFNDHYRIVQRAAWVLNHCATHHPALVKPYLKKLILNLNRPNVIDAVKRNTVRLLQFIDIPKNLQGHAADTCFRLLASSDEPVAVKAFSMTVLFNMGKSEPAIYNELKLLIEEQLPYGTAAFKSRGKKVLKQINRTF